MRAFRPGRYGAAADEEEVEEIKQAKMALYAARAKAKLPLFEDVIAMAEEEPQRRGHVADKLSA